MSVVLIDVNNLTAVNREYGVRPATPVLRHVARTIDATKRFNDVVARLGDDEFGVLLRRDAAKRASRPSLSVLRTGWRANRPWPKSTAAASSLWAGVCSGSITVDARA